MRCALWHFEPFFRVEGNYVPSSPPDAFDAKALRGRVDTIYRPSEIGRLCGLS